MGMDFQNWISQAEFTDMGSLSGHSRFPMEASTVENVSKVCLGGWMN